jgi:hypothetical protein
MSNSGSRRGVFIPRARGLEDKLAPMNQVMCESDELFSDAKDGGARGIWGE